MRKPKKGTIYLATSRDEYELPVAVADTVQELADMVGKPKKSVEQMISHKEGHYYRLEETHEKPSE